MSLSRYSHIARMLVVLAAAAGCAPNDTPDGAEPAEVYVADGIEYRARTALLGSYPVRLRTWVTVTNRSNEEVLLRFPDDCPVLLQVRARTGEVRWDQAGAEPCAGSPTERRLPPGDSVVFETLASAPAILGDSLPDDVYVLSAYLRPGNRGVLLQAGRANLVGLPDTVPARP
jgi:hypothetical protein